MTQRLPDLDDLALFVDVATSGSIGKAAVGRGLSQPSVSRRMSALERQIGVPLLERSRQGTRLTEAGQAVVGWSEQLLAAAEDFGLSVSALRSERTGTVRAAVSLTVAEHLAPRWLVRLQEVAPEFQISFEVHNSTDVADLVERGEVDIGFLESPSIRPAFSRRRIGWDRLVVAVSPDHPWADGGEVTAERVAAGRVLVRELGSGTRETLDEALDRAGLALANAVTMGSNAALVSAATGGVAPVIVSGLAVRRELAARSLVEVAVPDLDLRRPLTAVWRTGQLLAPGARALVAVALEGSVGGPGEE
ncbi:LysR family transcriptional regulator [Nocardioides insulae]|uniref:LysR family transcriptional regulator n=1 Tax=Nocardioides insulae TaxID=394734 RepID=UPI000402DEA6|nr:LysR family transcriptional regulator [Nocardioides insulae]